ncbi:MAG: lysophospholipid acyltransferase family protein [Cellvibrionaceae bacterium]
MSDEIINVDTKPQKLSNTFKTALSTLLLVTWIAFMLVGYLFFRVFLSSKLDRFYMCFHRGCCWIFSMRCHIKGEVSEKRPTLYLVNHISYLDIFVLGGILPGYFIAKSEVATWPILGWLAKIQNTLFFERKGRKVKEQLKIMSDHFDQKGNLILFPEGTSTEGEHVEPFKSSLLQSIEKTETAVIVQPVTISYTHYKNKPMDRFTRDHYAWYATMPFASHFFGALGLAKADVEVTLHAPVTLEQFETRKECTHYCWQQVSGGLKSSLENAKSL